MHSVGVAKVIQCLSTMTIVLLCSAIAAADTWEVQTWNPPFDYAGVSRQITYIPLKSASHKWQLCVSYPHLKDSYWFSVNYGMVEEAKRLNVALQLVEAGGYPNLNRQITQIQDCVAAGVDALIIGTVSFTGLTEAIKKIAQTVPVVAAVNDIQDEGISAKTGVSWLDMGRAIGDYLVRLHPINREPAARVAWFPGPKGAGWVAFIDKGFREAAALGKINIVTTKWGDTGKEIQRTLVQEALEAHPEIDYIVGNALAAEAAISVLRARGFSERIQVLSTYFTHGVFRGIKRGQIMAAPTDSPVLQGRLAIDQVVRILDNKPYLKHVGLAIVLIDQTNVEHFKLDTSLAPPSFTPTFTVD